MIVEEVHDSIDISSDDSAMPYCDICSHEDLSYDGGIGGYEDKALVVDVEVVEVHDVAGPADSFGVFAWGLESLGGEEMLEG